MKTIRILVPVLFAVFTLMCASAPAVLVSESDNAKAYSLKKGDIVKITLNAQLSTGYGWQVTSLSGVEQYGEIQVTTSGIPGGIDVQNIMFKALKAGDGFIELKYLRPWKKDDAPLKYFKVSLTVSE
jgi:predicted secreted protein